MEQFIYPENVYASIFGERSTAPWTEMEKNRQEAILLVEGAFFAFLQEELVKEDRNEEAIEVDVDGKIIEMRFDFTALEWITLYKLYFKQQKSMEEVAKEMGLLKEEVRSMVGRTLRKLRHPSISKQLKKYIPVY